MILVSDVLTITACCGQISRVGASRLPGYSGSGSGSPGGRNGFSRSRTQSADRRPPVVVSATAKTVLQQSLNTPPSTSSERSTSSTDTPAQPHDSPRRSTTRKTSHLRPPKTIVSRQRREDSPADDVIDTSPRHGIVTGE